MSIPISISMSDFGLRLGEVGICDLGNVFWVFPYVHQVSRYHVRGTSGSRFFWRE